AVANPAGVKKSRPCRLRLDATWRHHKEAVSTRLLPICRVCRDVQRQLACEERRIPVTSAAIAIIQRTTVENAVDAVAVGERAHGFAAAADVYFGKSLDKLSLPEMAILAALPKAPSRDNPVVNPDRAKERQGYV